METAETLASPPARRVLDRYRLERPLGSGGFGTVWLAEDERLQRPVAVKRIDLHVGEAGARALRAEREALAAARLQHPGIVALYEAGRDDEAWYLVSELVRGRTLGDLLAAGALSDRDVVLVGLSLCDALAHAHERGVVHRDVKPGNVMVCDRPDEGGTVAKLTDFGIARLVGDEALTRTGDVVGTLAYMAPEQAEGASVGPEADLYALALVLYEAVAGTNPVRASGPAATARRLGSPLPALGALRPDLPPALVGAIDRAVLPDPLERGTVAELRHALGAALPTVEDVPGLVAAELPGLDEPVRGVRAPAAAAAAGRRAAALPGRVLASAGAAALCAWALSVIPLRPEAAAVSPGAVAAGVALLVLVLPRAGWLAAALALAAAARSGGAAAVLLAAAAPVPLLLARRPAIWSLPAAAPALAAVGLAGAFPALAGQAGSPWARAALGALGAWWVPLAGALANPRPSPAAAAAVEVAMLAVVWGLAAAALPALVRGRAVAADLLGATAWAGALSAATIAAADALAVDVPAGTVGAAAAGAVLAVLARALRGPAARGGGEEVP